MTQSNARISMLQRDAVTPEVGEIYDALQAQRGVVPNMFRVLAHVPEVAQGVAGFLKPLLGDGALKGWYKELIAVRMAILCESEYAIRAHKISARQKGAYEVKIASVEQFEQGGAFDEKEKLGFRLADRLHKGATTVDDAFFAELQIAFSEPEIVELFLTAAAFEMFPRFVDGLRIPVTTLTSAK
jgi:alkylhydroperoxidase family enzyme